MDIFNNLKLNPSNPRTIKDVAFNKLKKSIKEFPEMLEKRPIVYDDNNIILGGNMRFRALQDLVKEGFVVKDEYFMSAQGWDELKKRTFVIKDNIEMGEWDDDVLANEWSDLPLEEWGIDTAGWSKEVEEDEAPEVSIEEPKSKRGEIYQLGKHRLMCGDSTKIEDVEKLMSGQKADMVFTDPPYGMFLDADFSGMKNSLDFAKDKGFVGGKKYSNVIGDSEDFNPDFINTIFALFSNAKEMFMWGANYYSELLQDRNKGSWFVWDKRLDESADKMYGSCFELCWSKNKHKQDIARVKWAGVFGTEKEFDHKRHHPTQKPVGLSVWFIDKFSKDSETVVDLFGGSGSTLIACEQLGRTCYMIELDEKYVDVIRKRYAKFIGQEGEWETITPAI